ncbi:MAG: thiolase family protein [Dehalococcoidia bacterium]|nr:thiolase family protein [Dehalococcoidia bacterium]
MRNAVIVDAVRTPIARAHPHKGWFRNIRSDELGVLVVKELVRRVGIDPAEIEDVILGCATQCGEQAMNVSRYISLMAGLPFKVGAQTINRQCASGLTAVNTAAQAIISGYGDVFIAGGIESMTHLPEGFGAKLNPRRFDFVDPTAASMGLAAENLVEMYHISRREQEEFALRSHQKAVAAQTAGRFKDEIVPVEITEEDGSQKIIDTDQNPRPYTTLELMGAFDSISKPDGTITSATASFASDGAAAIMLMSEERARVLGMKSVARIRSMAVAGVDPKITGFGTVAAAQKALDRAGLKPEDIDIVEINEAFAVVAMVCQRELGLLESRVNPNGGAVALGHPMGCTGAKLMTSLFHEMQHRKARFGLVTVGVGMGQGEATILERILL